MTTTAIGASRVASERRSGSEFVQSNECEGRTARDTLPELTAAIESLAAGNKDFRRWVPENGWGSVGGTFRFLVRVREVARQYPDRTWRASR